MLPALLCDSAARLAGRRRLDDRPPITTSGRLAVVDQALLGTFYIFKQTEQRLVLWPVAFG